MALLGGGEDSGAYAWEGSHRLLQVIRQNHPELSDWPPQEIMHFLYDWAHPNEAPTIVKIAPGYNADLWPDCWTNGYIRVGWELVGDLRAYTREEFGAAFAANYTALYKGNGAKITEKANEVWQLTELDEGDIVLANRGTARIVGMGRVKDPGLRVPAGAWRVRRIRSRSTGSTLSSVRSTPYDAGPSRPWRP